MSRARIMEDAVRGVSRGLVTFWILFAAGLVLVPRAAAADIDLTESGRLKLFGDFRFRLESDWNSKRSDGTERDDRDRDRVRGRLGLKWQSTETLSLGLRLRTGSRDSQQSPHITVIDFDNNHRGDVEALFDKWFLRLDGERAWGWAGRDSFPFWKQNELFWDDDVTPAGAAAGYRWTPGAAKLEIIGGFFALLDGAVDFHGEMRAGQVVYSRSDARWDVTLAGGLFAIDGEPGAELLRKGNGARDYTIWVANAQLATTAGSRSWVFGLDLMHNSESYSADDPDPFTAANRDETDGWVVSVRWGSTRDRGDWMLGYWYARVETLAVHASYAQDDWIRWGSATQTDASDFEGHELRVAWGLGKGMNLVARLYLVEAITSEQDGNRARIDFNYKF